jgi:hypothetical protein
MAKTSEVPPTNIVEATPEQDAPEHWPSLDSAGTKKNEEWEMVPPQPAAAAAQVTFDVDAIHITNDNPRTLKHCQSSPNLLNYQVEEDASEEESAATIEDSSMMSASVVVVPSPSPDNIASSFAKVSFKDAILSKSDHGVNQNDTALNGSEPKQSTLRKVKPKFVVTPIKRCVRSTGDLKAMGRDMNDEDEVLGDGDAHEFYSRKAHGSATRQNGLKTRPDEAKRLQMILAKKNVQRERQQARNG